MIRPTTYFEMSLQRIGRMTSRKLAEAAALMTGRASGKEQARLIAILDMLDRYDREKRIAEQARGVEKQP